MVENERVNATAGAAVKRCVRAGRPTLVLVRYRRQGFQVRDRLRYKEKLPTVYVDGDTPTDERQEVQARLARGEVLAVVSTPALDVGVDLPNLRAVVLLSRGKSENKAIQRIGAGAPVRLPRTSARRQPSGHRIDRELPGRHPTCPSTPKVTPRYQRGRRLTTRSQHPHAALSHRLCGDCHRPSADSARANVKYPRTVYTDVSDIFCTMVLSSSTPHHARR
jgi:hypothetical protein